MIAKTRTKSKELLTLESLDIRMNLATKDKQHYQSLVKGYEGEVLFDSMVEDLPCDCIIIPDLLLRVNNTTFQIDSVIITSNTIYLNEIKNFVGDYYYESDRLFTKSGTEINNPYTQLQRCESLLRQLFQNLGFNIPISAFVIFINQNFTLYQAPLNRPFIFPTQIEPFIKKLGGTPSKLNRSHTQLAEKLVSLHIHDSPYKQIPPYEYVQLQKGISCIACKSLSISVQGNKCVCLDCGIDEKLADAVMRSVTELKLLFPQQKITTQGVYEWCKVVSSKRRINRILENNLKKFGANRWTYFE